MESVHHFSPCPNLIITHDHVHYPLSRWLQWPSKWPLYLWPSPFSDSHRKSLPNLFLEDCLIMGTHYQCTPWPLHPNKNAETFEILHHMITANRLDFLMYPLINTEMPVVPEPEPYLFHLFICPLCSFIPTYHLSRFFKTHLICYLCHEISANPHTQMLMLFILSISDSLIAVIK